MREKNKLAYAVFVMAALCVIMGICIAGFGTSPHVPLIFICVIATIVAMICGSKWDELLVGIRDSISESLEALIILMLIGVLIGTWIACGSVQTVIYYGLGIISGKVFLPATMLLCTLVAFVIGSWGTVGTVGLAFMGIGMTLGLPAPLVAGAIVSGAYLGEMISPLSDAVNLASALSKENAFTISKAIQKPGILAFIIAEVIYFAMGFASGAELGEVGDSIEPVRSALMDNFHLGLVPLVPIIIMFVCVAKKVPAIASVVVGIISATFVAALGQDISIGELLKCYNEGYVCNTGNELIDGLLTAGGLNEMMFTIAIILLAMAFGGIMKSSGLMDALVMPLRKILMSKPKRNFATVLIGSIMNLFMSDQYLAMSFTGQMVSDYYEDREQLGKCLLCGAGPTSPLVPWNSCGIYVSGILGVSAISYGCFAVLNYTLPLVGILFALIGLKNERR